MRICKTDIKMIRPGELREKHQDKRPARTLTAAQKRKIAALRKRLEEENRVRMNMIPKGVEIRC